MPSDRAGTMDVPPHPHTGLQTVSWLYAGEIEHRDSTGSHALIEPGQVNLMTAGAGIQHSEVSTARSRELHGVQLWVALLDRARHVASFFESFSLVAGVGVHRTRRGAGRPARAAPAPRN